MSYRERIAWLSLSAMVLAYGSYFSLVARDPGPWEPWPHQHPLGPEHAGEVAAAADLAFDAQLRLVQAQHVLDDGQPEAGAAAFA